MATRCHKRESFHQQTFLFATYTSNVQAAVLFTANIAFLAIPSLLPPDTGAINAAAAASIISIILSLSSIIFGQLLNKKIETLAEEPTAKVVSVYSRC